MDVSRFRGRVREGGFIDIAMGQAGFPGSSGTLGGEIFVPLT
jgi:hypothetical protein